MIYWPIRLVRSEPGGAPTDFGSAITFGWRVHQAQEAWTAKVDIKASIVLALDGAVLVAVISGHSKDGVLAALSGWRDFAVAAAVCLVLVALLLAALVVRPALGSSRRHRADHRDHLIYFGHLRHWQATQLAQELRDLSPAEETAQLARQLVAMSRRNWLKHTLLQWSLYTTGGGALILTVAALWPR